MSDFQQESFKSGMNLQDEDTRLPDSAYVVGFNLRNRNDVLEGVLESVEDVAAPPGLKQGILTFGNYVICFVAGKAYYRYYTATGWTAIDGFAMNITAPRYWFAVVPVATTNYARLGTLVVNAGGSDSDVVDPNSPIVRSSSIVASAQGNNPGLLVQDNIQQPQFIFIGPKGTPICRTTQSYAQWSISIDVTTLIVSADNREYVPIGNNMAWVDGVLYMASQDGNFIYRSVSGRPLDFVVNVDETGQKGGDATTTSYSVGVGGISCLKEMSDGSVFVAASNANFLVGLNKTPGAPTIFGEYTFVRKFLFNATCLSDRVIIDSLGDTRFVDLTGVRSFNAILQQQNEGRNSVFSARIQSALTKLPTDSVDLVQNPLLTAAILYDNYELYAVNTIFGPAIAVYDTIQECWSSFDISQTGGKRVKQFAKIESTIQRLYAITEDDKLFTLYIGAKKATASVRTIAVSRNTVYNGQNEQQATPKGEIKLMMFRAVLNRLTEDSEVTATPFVNNRITSAGQQIKSVPYTPPSRPYTGPLQLPDIDTQLSNILFSFPDCGQGWKAFMILSWTNGTIVQYSMEMNDVTPMNPLLSQKP